MLLPTPLTGINLGPQRAHRARDAPPVEQAGRHRRGFIALAGLAVKLGEVMQLYRKRALRERLSAYAVASREVSTTTSATMRSSACGRR